MPLLYPRFITWRVELGDAQSADVFFSAKTLSRIRKVNGELESAGYRIAQCEVDQYFLDAFVPVYVDLIGGKERGLVYDVREAIARGKEKGTAYRAIALWKGEQLIGALIYSIYEKSLSCAYRVFPHELPVNLPVNLSMVIEYLFFSTALELGKRIIIHGKDRNAYGLHANIGLAQYKIRLGCIPYVSKAEDNELLPLPGDCGGVDALFFLKSEAGRKITDAILVSDLSREELKVKFPSLMADDAHVRVRLVRHGERIE